MYWKVFYILPWLLQLTVCDEIEEFEVPYEFLSSSEYQEISPVISNSVERDHGNVVKSNDQDKDSNEETSDEDVVSFAGPVKAQGTVAVAANFGYNAPGFYSYPSYSLNPWFQLFSPQYFYHPSLVYPIPYTFPYISTTSMFIPGLGGLSYLQNDLEKPQSKESREDSKKGSEKTQCKVDAKPSRKSKSDVKKSRDDDGNPGKKDFILEITPMMKIIETVLPKDKIETEKPAKKLSSDEIPAKSVAFLDEDFTDYDANNPLSDNLTDNYIKNKKDVANDSKDEKETDSPEDRIVFGGFVPASGSVRIVARF